MCPCGFPRRPDAVLAGDIGELDVALKDGPGVRAQERIDRFMGRQNAAQTIAAVQGTQHPCS
jgi:hypothetical protein